MPRQDDIEREIEDSRWKGKVETLLEQYANDICELKVATHDTCEMIRAQGMILIELKANQRVSRARLWGIVTGLTLAGGLGGGIVAQVVAALLK